MTLLAVAVLLSVPSQDANQRMADRHYDEAIVEAVAKTYLPKKPEKTKVSFLALWPEYSRSVRQSFKEEIERLLAWPQQSLSDEERANLVKVKDSIASSDWSPPKLLSISEMRLDERILVTKTDFNRSSFQVVSGRGVRGRVIKQIRMDAPSYSADGKWAVVHPRSLLWGEGTGAWYDGIFLKHTSEGWRVDFKVVVYGNG